jgi:hypothetical protein
MRLGERRSFVNVIFRRTGLDFFRIMLLVSLVSMIFSENRFPLFRIML